jgi:hypothetical protein
MALAAPAKAEDWRLCYVMGCYQSQCGAVPTAAVVMQPMRFDDPAHGGAGTMMHRLESYAASTFNTGDGWQHKTECTPALESEARAAEVRRNFMAMISGSGASLREGDNAAVWPVKAEATGTVGEPAGSSAGETAATGQPQTTITNMPLKELQGLWYDVNHNVTVEIRNNEVRIRDLGTKDVTVNLQHWTPGSLIASYSGAKQDRDAWRFTGQCWNMASKTLLSPCLDVAAYFNRPGTKPHWMLTIAGLTLVRRDQFTPANWKGRD